MKCTSIIVCLSALALPVFAHSSLPFVKDNSVAVGTGRLEGTVTNDGNMPVWAPMNHGGVHIKGVSEDGRCKFDVASDTTLGGHYQAAKLRPGFYDLTISAGYINGIAFRPKVIYGVEVKANAKTVLPIKLDMGDTLEVEGTPVYATPEAARAAESTQAPVDKGPVTIITPSEPVVAQR